MAQAALPTAAAHTGAPRPAAGGFGARSASAHAPPPLDRAQPGLQQLEQDAVAADRRSSAMFRTRE